MRKFVAGVLVCSSVAAGAADGGMHVSLQGERLTVCTSLETEHTLQYEFRRCMDNELYTFSKVLVDGVAVNEATSDNIGPFLIAGRGWTGGNHLLPDGKTPSAQTVGIEISADGGRLLRDTLTDASRIDIAVTNRLLDPANPDSLFCVEKMHYTVCGNSIQVEAEHTYLNAEEWTVDRYYGMQSMMKEETALLTPGGLYSVWTPIENVGRFPKKSAPLFRQFVEKSPVCYAAAYLCGEGLGDRRFVAPDDVVFIGNSWSKSYHKLMGNAVIKRGDVTRWKGIYTWFLTPLKDVPGQFAYRGWFDGKEAVFCSREGRPDCICLSDGNKKH